MIWRPVMAGHVTIEGIRRGEVTLTDLLKINALMDAQAAQTAAK